MPSSVATTPLAPVPRPVGIFEPYIAKTEETLIVKEKLLSLTGDSFDICLANGQPVFKVKGRKMTISGRKSLYDMNGNHLFDIVKEHFHLHATYACLDPQEKKILEVKNSFTLTGSKANITFTSRDGTAETLQMKGNFLNRAAEIIDTKGNFPVARIKKDSWNARNLLGGQQTYALSVAPGVDMALMVALAIALDEKNHDAQGGGGA